MDVVDRIRWIPDFGHERELDWLRNMHDWMISKKRYWGLALPIYDCAECGTIEVIGGREELEKRAVEGWSAFEGHTPHRPYVDAVKIACPGCGAPVERIKDVGNPWLDAGIVPFSTLHFREEPDVLAPVVPGRLHHRELPGPVPQLVLLDARDVDGAAPRGAVQDDLRLRACCSPRTAGQMHKSWGNAIDFDEAADRMGVDVMRWMFIKARPEDNILFGWHAADESRRELLVLWNVYSFFVTYARLAGWTPGEQAPAVAERPILDRWILSRAAGTAAAMEDRLQDVDSRWRDPRAVELPRRPLHVVSPAVAAAVLALERLGRPSVGVCDAPRGAHGDRPDARAHPAVPRRIPLPEPRRVRAARRARQRPPDALAERGSGRPPRPEPRNGDGRRARRRGSGTDAAQHGSPQEPAAAGPGMDRVAGPWLGDRR